MRKILQIPKVDVFREVGLIWTQKNYLQQKKINQIKLKPHKTCQKG